MKNLITSFTPIKTCIGGFLLFGLLMVSSASASEEIEDYRHYEQKLEKLHKSIDKVKKHLKTTRYKRGNVVTDLKKLEGEISKNALALQSTEARIKSLNQDISRQKSELNKVNAKLKLQREQLGGQIRAAYAVGNQEQIKMLLNQQQPAEMGRVMVYFDYLNRARQEQIALFIENIEQKQRIEASLNAALSDQEKSLTRRKKQKRSLDAQRLKRNQLLARLNREINNQEKNLSELEVSRGRIENLLMSLGELLADIPQEPSASRPFKQQKGKLPWPAKGPFLARFGQSRNQGDLKWNGVLIGAEYGSPVRAVSRGRVAFADWLQGFGFITIIDHGDGYMSLYGHNESLFKQPGDWVNAGDVIATTGDSGGQPLPGVYFEIRSRGKPVNPKKWCSKSAKYAASTQ